MSSHVRREDVGRPMRREGVGRIPVEVRGCRRMTVCVPMKSIARLCGRLAFTSSQVSIRMWPSALIMSVRMPACIGR